MDSIDLDLLIEAAGQHGPDIEPLGQDVHFFTVEGAVEFRRVLWLNTPDGSTHLVTRSI